MGLTEAEVKNMILRMQMCVMVLRVSQRPIISGQSFVKENRSYVSSEFACSSVAVAWVALLESPLFI